MHLHLAVDVHIPAIDTKRDIAVNCWFIVPTFTVTVFLYSVIDGDAIKTFSSQLTEADRANRSISGLVAVVIRHIFMCVFFCPDHGQTNGVRVCSWVAYSVLVFTFATEGGEWVRGDFAHHVLGANNYKFCVGVHLKRILTVVVV